jgi:5-bromo-4-chloroindolyl phosphate hydrolysis protein
MKRFSNILVYTHSYLVNLELNIFLFSNTISMKKILTSCMVALLATSAMAQIKVPAASPAASVSQTIGVTDVSVKYSRPSLKGREAIGKLLPYGKVWRTGANQATQFTTSNDIKVGGKSLAAGTYSVFSIPGANAFTVIFNKDQGASEQSYKEEKDALRIEVPTTAIAKKETMGISFEDLTDSTATMAIAWETSLVNVPLQVENDAAISKAIDKNLADNSNGLRTASEYLLSQGKNLDKALQLADLSIASKETFRNVYQKAQILNKLGRYAEALPLAQKALSLGQADNSGIFGFFKDGIEKSISDISSKIPAVPEVLKGGKKKK